MEIVAADPPAQARWESLELGPFKYAVYAYLG